MVRFAWYSTVRYSVGHGVYSTVPYRPYPRRAAATRDAWGLVCNDSFPPLPVSVAAVNIAVCVASVDVAAASWLALITPGASDIGYVG